MPTETKTRTDLAKTMTCTEHRDGVIHYRAAYASYECHVYRDRVLFTHVVADTPWPSLDN